MAVLIFSSRFLLLSAGLYTRIDSQTFKRQSKVFHKLLKINFYNSLLFVYSSANAVLFLVTKVQVSNFFSKIEQHKPYDTGGAEGAIAPPNFSPSNFFLHRILKEEK